MDACPYGYGGKSDHGSHFQYTWTEQEKGKHINWLELRAARYALSELASPGEVVQFHVDNMTAIAFIRRLGGTCSLALCKESHQLWQEAIDRNITILSPQRLALKVNTEADFLSRHSLRRWDFKLISLDFRRVCCKLQVWPNFDAFASDGAHQVDRYMTLDIDPNAVATNALDYY